MGQVSGTGDLEFSFGHGKLETASRPLSHHLLYVVVCGALALRGEVCSMRLEALTVLVVFKALRREESPRG